MILLIQIIIFSAIYYFMLRAHRGDGLEHAHSKEYPDGLIDTHKGKISKIGVNRIAQRTFIIVRERWYHRIFKFLGLAVEISTGDETLDKKLYFICDDEDYLADAFAKKEVQTLLAHLFLQPIRTLYATRNKMWVVPRFIGRLNNEADHKNGLWENLSQLAKALEEIERAHGVYHPSSLRTKALLFVVAHAALCASAFFILIPTFFSSTEITSLQSLVNVGAVIGMVLAVGWAVLIQHLLAGTSWLGWVAADFLLFGVFGFMVCGIALTRETNILLDRSEQQIYSTPLLQKTCHIDCKRRSGKHTYHTTYPLTEQQCLPENRQHVLQSISQNNSKCRSGADLEYRMWVLHWDPQNNPYYSFAATAQNYDMAKVEKPINIPLHKGFWGVEWVDIEEITPTP